MRLERERYQILSLLSASTSHALCSQVSSSSVNSQRPSTGHANNHSSGRSSDYAQLADCVDAANHSGCMFIQTFSFNLNCFFIIIWLNFVFSV